MSLSHMSCFEQNICAWNTHYALCMVRNLAHPSEQWGAWWLRHYASNRQVAGSISDDVIGVFQWHNPSGRTMALGSTQPLTEMSTWG